MRLAISFDPLNVERSLRELPGAVGLHVRNLGLRAAAKLVVTQARSSPAFRDRTGRLRKSIRVRNRSGYIILASGRRQKLGAINARAQAGGRGAFQAHLVEKGHGGPKPAPPHPYLLPAYEQTQGQQLGVAINAMRRAFDRTVMRLGTGNTTRRIRRLSSLDV